MKDQTAFSTRFARHKDELEWLFMELYHNREGLEVLEREMAEAYNARSAELKALDKARSADPDWYKRGNMFGMTMYTDLFAGNLKELAKKLPYLKEQKLTYLHLMPLLQMPHPHNDGGYAVEDFDTVDPALGTNKDLENLTRELRKAGISLCLDFVMNHTASTTAGRWRQRRATRGFRRITISMTTAPSPTSTSRPFRRCSPTPHPATLHGARRCTSGC